MLKIKKDSDIIDFFNKLILNELINFHCWIAGGSILSYIDNRPINDLDIYFKNEEERTNCLDYLLRNGAIITTDNIITTKVYYNNKTLDLIRVFFKTPQNCVDYFDLSICGIATDGDKVYKVYNFYNDWRKKLLVWNNINGSPPLQFIRMQKYLMRGYRMDDEETVKLLYRLQKSTEKEIMDIGRTGN